MPIEGQNIWRLGVYLTFTAIARLMINCKKEKIKTKNFCIGFKYMD